jgi:hypothetical protein
VESLAIDSRSAIIIGLVRKLYAIERECAGMLPAERKSMRHERSLPILGQINEARRELEKVVLPKSPLGEALTYIRNQWEALNRFLGDGRLRIDNNGAEYQLRAVAVGRKNWLLAGSFEGARRAATLYSLVQSCRLVSIDPYLYFRDVLLRIATHPHRQVGELIPRMWAKLGWTSFSRPKQASAKVEPTRLKTLLSPSGGFPEATEGRLRKLKTRPG